MRMMIQKRRAWSNVEKAVVEELYSTLGPSVVGKMLDRTPDTVYAQAKRLGLPKWECRFNRTDPAKVRELAFEGKNFEELSVIFHLKEGTLWRFLRLHKIRLRDAATHVYVSDENKNTERRFLLNQIRLFNLSDLYSRCCVCDWSRSLIDFAHLIARTKGGTFTIDNIVPLCPNHHRLQGKNLLSQAELRLVKVFNEEMCSLLAKNKIAVA